MAEVDRLELVLDAQTDKFEAEMEGAEQATKDFGRATEEAALQNIEMMMALEGLSGGLNQTIGGYSKSIAAAQQLGYVSDENYAKLEKARYQMELVAGPMEMVIALTKISTAMKMLFTSATAAETTATTGATAATWGFNTALLANPVVIIVIAVLSLVAVMLLLEKKFGLVTKSVDALSDAFDVGIDKIKQLLGLYKKLFKMLSNPIGGGVGKLFQKEKHGGR